MKFTFSEPFLPLAGKIKPQHLRLLFKALKLLPPIPQHLSRSHIILTPLQVTRCGGQNGPQRCPCPNLWNLRIFCNPWQKGLCRCN